MTKKSVLAVAFAIVAGSLSGANASTVYLNISNITVAVGPKSTFTTSNNTFNAGQTIAKAIDAPSADAEEFHNQTTHLWFSGGALELIFDFGINYDIGVLHFWNYTSEAFDVDDIDFEFFDELGGSVGSLSVQPALGSSPGIKAQDIPLAAPLNVRSVSALLTGTNGQVDFQNVGFTANVSAPPPPPPSPQPSPIPLPAGLLLLPTALLGLRLAKGTRGT